MPATDLTQSQIRAAANDAEAMEAVYRRYSDQVWGFALRRCHDADEAADLVASVFLIALESADAFDETRGRPIAWLLGIASRRLADARRRGAREQDAMRRLLGRELLADDERVRVDERIDALRRASALKAPLGALSRAEREVLYLVAYHDLTPSEAASVLGIRPIAARVRLARARRRLAEAEGRPAGVAPPKEMPQ